MAFVFLSIPVSFGMLDPIRESSFPVSKSGYIGYSASIIVACSYNNSIKLLSHSANLHLSLKSLYLPRSLWSVSASGRHEDLKSMFGPATSHRFSKHVPLLYCTRSLNPHHISRTFLGCSPLKHCASRMVLYLAS